MKKYEKETRTTKKRDALHENKTIILTLSASETRLCLEDRNDALTHNTTSFIKNRALTLQRKKVITKNHAMNPK